VAFVRKAVDEKRILILFQIFGMKENKWISSK